MELAILNEAQECFLEALALRKTKGNFSLIDSTQQALNLLKELKQHRASIDNSDI